MPSKRIRARKKRKIEKLNVTSMMDMFTIILVFLLKSYSAEGQLVTPAAGLEIPKSLTDLTAKRPPVEIKVSELEIAVGDRVVALVKEEINKKEMVIENLVEALKKEKENATKATEAEEKEFKGELMIQGDKNMTYKLLTKVMYSCGQAGYAKQNFVVYKNE